MAKIRALGTTISFNSQAIGGMSSIGDVSVNSDELDVTSLDSASGYREFLQGFKDSGEVTLTGFHKKTDAGQVALRTGYGTGDIDATLITFPDSVTVGFNAYVKGYTIGPAEVDGAVGFSAVLRITGAVTVTVP
jgi:predicted secreted protein